MADSISIAFTGDIGFDKFMEKKWEDEELISQELLDFLHSANHVIANVEGPILDKESNKNTQGAAQLVHSIDPAAVKVLNDIHGDIWNICNNHIMDEKEIGIESTLYIARLNNVMTIGAGMNIDEASRPYIINDAGGIGVFSVGYSRACRIADDNTPGCLNWTRMDLIEKNIKEIKKKCKWCVIIAHDGEEFTALPNPYTRNRFLRYLDMGADIIVAHHPHVPMNYETVGDKIIFYSLGNFIFDTPYQRSQFNTQKGLLLKINFTNEDYSFEAKGLEIDRSDERIKPAELPKIFMDVCEEEYKKLIPLAAKMFVKNTKRQQIYMNPTLYENASDEVWQENFMNPMRGGRVEGEILDFYKILPLAEREKEKAWESSKLDDIKDFIIEQL